MVIGSCNVELEISQVRYVDRYRHSGRDLGAVYQHYMPKCVSFLSIVQCIPLYGTIPIEGNSPIDIHSNRVGNDTYVSRQELRREWGSLINLS